MECPSAHLPFSYPANWNDDLLMKRMIIIATVGRWLSTVPGLSFKAVLVLLMHLIFLTTWWWVTFVVQSLSWIQLFCNPKDFSLPGSFCPWDFPDKNTGVGRYFLLQGIFLTQGSNLHLLYWQEDSLPLNHLGSPTIVIRDFNTPQSLMSKSSRQKSTKKCWNQTIYQMNLDAHIEHSNQQQQNTHSFQIHVEHSTRQIIW